MNGRAASPLHRLLTANAEFFLTPARFHLFIAIFLLALFLMKSLLFPGIGGDDGEQLIFAQYFDWGYVVRNPPLYTWFVIASQKVFGASALAVNAVKFTTLFFLYWFLYRTGITLFKDQRLAIVAALSPLLIFHIAWDSLLGFSHSVLVATIYAATLCAFFNLERNHRTLSYIGLGVAIGFGILSKYAFVFFLVALLAAGLFDAKLRSRILNPKIIFSLVAAGLIATPHLLWLAERHAALAGEIAPALQAQGTTAHILAAGKGLFSGIRAIVGFLLPLLIFLAVFFPAAWRPKLSSFDLDLQRYHRILGIFFIILIGLILTVIIVGGVAKVRTHYMFVMVLLPLFFFLRVKMAAVSQQKINGYTGVLFLTAVIVLLGLPIKYLAEPWRCGKCEHHMPYKTLAADLKKNGFRNGTIFAYWHPYPIAGNLRIAFPKARVISAKHPMAIAPIHASARPSAGSVGQCLLIWSGAAQGSQASNTISLAKRYLNVEPKDIGKASTVQARLPTGTKKEFQLGYVLMTPGRGRCR